MRSFSRERSFRRSRKGTPPAGRPPTPQAQNKIDASGGSSSESRGSAGTSIAEDMLKELLAPVNGDFERAKRLIADGVAGGGASWLGRRRSSTKELAGFRRRSSVKEVPEGRARRPSLLHHISAMAVGAKLPTNNEAPDAVGGSSQILDEATVHQAWAPFCGIRWIDNSNPADCVGVEKKLKADGFKGFALSMMMKIRARSEFSLSGSKVSMVISMGGFSAPPP
eukprot:4977661-Prymnesium_polylepis.1